MELRAGTAFLAFLILASLASAAADDGFRKVDGPCGLQFPEDHGAHRNYRTEWWYYTGNLQTGDGRPFGFQLTFFRSALSPPPEKRQADNRSTWRTANLFIGHAALTDVDGRRHLTAEAAGREALGMAGAGRENGKTVVFVGDWKTRIGTQAHLLRAAGAAFSFDLELRPEKPPVLHGPGGYSRKGDRPQRASCYYSMTRLRVKGNLHIDGTTLPAGGLAWMDHEFSTAPLEPGLVGWDWFSLQLSDGTDLMVYLLRKEGGGFHAASSATYIDARGQGAHIGRSRLSAAVLERWQSPATGAVYPVAWELKVSEPKIALEIRARLKNQEMDARRSTGIVYWEGGVTAEGAVAESPVEGIGYMELTGYHRPFDAPM